MSTVPPPMEQKKPWVLIAVIAGGILLLWMLFGRSTGTPTVQTPYGTIPQHQAEDMHRLEKLEQRQHEAIKKYQR